MRTGISITLTPSDRQRLEAVASNRNTAQKHVWRAVIVLLSADGICTTEIMRRTGTSKRPFEKGDSLGASFVIHTMHVDTTDAGPYGRDRAEDEALSDRSHR